MGLDGTTLSKLEELQEKYEKDGQAVNNYLDGLKNADYLSYWNYIGLDVLLSNQNTITNVPDEKVFLVYHQITELYFNLCLHELEAVDENDINGFEKKLDRLIRYFQILIESFRIMLDGLDSKEFLIFRKALHPASGFQSVQFRKIEILSTQLIYLINSNNGDKNIIKSKSLEVLYNQLYWKKGAINKETGIKSITLKRFEEKYDYSLLEWIRKYNGKDLWSIYLKIGKNNSVIEELMRKYDHLVNVVWGQIHFKVAEKHLNSHAQGLNATGGTSWKKYLNPESRKRIFYPNLWTAQEKDKWGEE